MSKENKSSSFGRTLFIALLSLGMGAGGFWFYDHNIAKATPAHSEVTDNAAASAKLVRPQSDVSYQPIFLDIAPFTVTLRNDMESRVLYMGMTLRIADEDSKHRLERYLPVVRSRILSELIHMNPSQLNNQEALTRTRERIKQVVSAPIAPEPNRQLVDDILFTSFVVQ